MNELKKREPANLLGTKLECLDVLLQTGKLLMESAADTSRVLRNMKRTARYLGLPEEQLQVLVNYNMLTVNLSDGKESIVKMQRCEHHGIDMTTLADVSNLTRRALREKYPLETYKQGLEDVRTHRRKYSPWLVTLGAGFACGGFCIQFGSDWTAFLYASIAAMIGFWIRGWLVKKGSNVYVNVGVAAFVATLVAWLFASFSIAVASWECVPSFIVACFHSDTPWHPLMSCALFIVPGVPLINFVNDMLSGYAQVGCTRAVQTLMILIAMAFGIAFAIQVCGIDNFVRDLNMIPHHRYYMYVIAAMISATGFSMIFNTPRYLLAVVALGGVIAICTRNFVWLGGSNGNIGLDMGAVVGAFAGSAIVSILCTRVVRKIHVPHHCIAIPSVIPMIPGVLMYRALFGFIDIHGVVGEVTIAVNNAIHAALIILCIAVGVAIPNIFIRRLIELKKEEE